MRTSSSELKSSSRLLVERRTVGIVAISLSPCPLSLDLWDMYGIAGKQRTSTRAIVGYIEYEKDFRGRVDF